MNTMISIIIPVYKVEKYLDKCIKSIVSQTYSNLMAHQIKVGLFVISGQH